MPADVTIIGAGPAGSIAAIALARRGWRVSVVEQHRFPRDKVCGESLSALAVSVLERLNLADDLQRLAPAHLRETIFHATDGRHLRCPLPAPMWGLSRHTMDAHLLDAARAAGATIIQPARCEALDNGSVRVRDLESNYVETLTAAWTLLADGKGALLPQRPQPTTDFGIKGHFRDVSSPRDAVELFGVHGHYVGVAPIEAGLVNVAFSVPAARLERFRGDLVALWRHLLTENPALADRFREANQVGGWLAAPLPRFGVARHWPPRVIPLGNAAAALEPIGGEGMGLAMRSAELAADALHRANATRSNAPVAALRDQFASLWKARRLACRALAKLLGQPAIAGDLMDLVGVNPPLARAAMALIGK